MKAWTRMVVMVVSMVFLWPLVTLGGDRRNDPASQAGDKKVLAFYMPWYRAKPVDGRWSKWNANGHRPPEDIACPYYPLLGPYTSTQAEQYRVVDIDGRVKTKTSIKWHMKWMADANIDVVVVDWWGQKNKEYPENEPLPDQLMPEIMQEAMARGLKVAIVRDAKSVASDRLEDDFYYILNKYVYNPAVGYDACYWTIAGRPVIMHWGNQAASEDATFKGVFDRVRNNTGQYGGGPPPLIISNATTEFKDFYISGKSVDVARKIVKRSADGLFLWAIPYDQTWHYEDWIGKVSAYAPGMGIANVMPGFDNSKFQRNGDLWIYVPRSDQNYRTAWGNTSTASYVSITSFNDFTEAHQIEPAQDYRQYETYGTPNDPFLYISITQQEAAWFKR